VELTTHLHVVPRSKNTPSWRGAQLKGKEGQLYLTFTVPFPRI